MNPLLIMALLTAASSAANYAGQKKVDKGRAVAMRESERRRKEAEARSAESAQSTTQLLTNAGRSQDAKAAEIEARYSSRPSGPLPTTAHGGYTAPPRSTLTVESDQRQMDAVKAEAAAQSHAQAGLNAYGDAMVDAKIGANRNLTDIEQQNTGVRNWNQYVMPAQMQAANESGKDWATLADAIQIASAIYGPMALSKPVGVAAEAAKAGEAAKAASLAGPHDLFDPYSWQKWLRPQAASSFSVARPM